MPDRLRKFRNVKDGDYRPLARVMSSFQIAGLLYSLDGRDPEARGFAEHAYEVLCERFRLTSTCPIYTNKD